MTSHFRIVLDLDVVDAAALRVAMFDRIQGRAMPGALEHMTEDSERAVLGLLTEAVQEMPGVALVEVTLADRD